MASDESCRHFLCLSCDKSFSSKKGLRLHAKKVHHGQTGSRIPPAKIECLELGCSFRCRQLAEFRKHLSESHGHSFAEMTCQFQDVNHFHSWLRNFEKQNHVEFYRNTMNINQNSKVVYYRCNRSGFYRVSNKKVQRRTKQQGSCKIEGHCTAYIKSKEDYNTGEVTMNMCNTHYGHAIQLTHLRLPKEDKRLIEEKLTSGLELDDVIKEVKNTTVTNSVDRTGLIKQKDVYNVISKLRTMSTGMPRKAESPTCNISLELLSDDYEENDPPSVTHCLNESSAIDSLRESAVSILQEVLLDLQALTDLLLLHDICNHAEALKGLVKSSLVPELITNSQECDHMLAVPNMTFITSSNPDNHPQYATQAGNLNQDTVLLHVTKNLPSNQSSDIDICDGNHALVQLTGSECSKISQALHLAPAGGMSGQLAPDGSGEQAGSEASSECGAGDSTNAPDPCWAAGSQGVFPAPMEDEEIRTPFQGSDNSVMLRINDVTDVLNDTAREDAVGGGCHLTGPAGDGIEEHATFHVSQGHSNDVFMSEENIQFSSGGVEGSSYLLGGADGGDVLHNVLNPSHTSFSKDGRTCFVHVDKAMCDQEIRIVLT